jgi:hypothetical protein
LRLLLSPKDRESVSGDLLEEYRDTIVPALGSAADRWYVRQVGSLLFRASWPWSAVVGGALVIRYLFDTLVPVTDYRTRATILTYTLMTACVLTGFSAAWRTRSIRGGVLISFSAVTMGALVSIVGAGVMLAIWHDPVELERLRNSGGLREGFVGVPLIVVALGVVLGLAGALLGKGMAKSLPTQVKSA